MLINNCRILPFGRLALLSRLYLSRLSKILSTMLSRIRCGEVAIIWVETAGALQDFVKLC